MLRKIFFWAHLVSGVVVGLVVVLMSATGVGLAFQPQIEGWLRSDLQALDVDPSASRLSLQELQALAEAARGADASALTVPSAPAAAVTIHFGRTAPTFIHPWTGAILEDPAAGWAKVFGTLHGWHRWLGASGDDRAIGRAITGASNLAFVFLMASGLFLWFPRKWTARAFRTVMRFRFRLRGKARDWNWHHTIGFWSLPILLVLGVSGVVISYQWAHRLVFTVAGVEAPPPGRPGPPEVDVPTPPADAALLSLEELVDRAKSEAPAATELRLALGPSPAAGGTAGAQHMTAREAGAFPPFASLTLSFDPYQGELLHRQSFEDLDRGRRLRSWLRFLHTGEALGWPGQLVAALASAGAVVLVWTGLALGLRRFSSWRRRKSSRGVRIPRPHVAPPKSDLDAAA